MAAGRVADSSRSRTSNESAARVGVLVVHGMGRQSRGDTLIEVGEPIIDWLNDWYDRSTAHDPVASAVDMIDTELSRSHSLQPDVPAHTTIRLRDGLSTPEASPILLAESWWAEDFRPATFREVLRWGVSVCPFILNDTLGYVWRQKRLVTNGQWLLTLLFAPVLQLMLLLTLPVALVPIFRGIVGRAMAGVASTFGDPYLLVSSPVRLSSMVERVHHDLRWLHRVGETRRITIMAHSQGAAIAHLALRTLPADLVDHIEIHRFITYGPAIEKLHRLQNLTASGVNLVRSGVARNTIVLLMLAAVLGGWRVDVPLPGSSSLSSDLLVGAVWIAGTVAFWKFPTPGLPRRRSSAQVYWHSPADDPDDPVWQNYHSPADPVALGPLPRRTIANVETRNRDSVRVDHTYYKHNVEQFLSRVSNQITADANWPPVEEAATRHAALDLARRQRSMRVDWLNRASLISAATVVLALLILIVRGRLHEPGDPLATVLDYLGDEFRIPFEAIIRQAIGTGELADTIFSLLTILVGSLAWSSLVLATIWERWCAYKTGRLLDDGDPGPVWSGGRIFLVLAVIGTPALGLGAALLIGGR